MVLLQTLLILFITFYEGKKPNISDIIFTVHTQVARNLHVREVSFISLQVIAVVVYLSQVWDVQKGCLVYQSSIIAGKTLPNLSFSTLSQALV